MTLFTGSGSHSKTDRSAKRYDQVRAANTKRAR